MLKIKSFLFTCCHSDANRTEDPTVDSQARRGELTTNDGTQIEKLSKFKEEDTQQAPLLILTAVEGNILPIGTQMKINPAGLLEGGRGKRDGITYIGCQKYSISPIDSQQQLHNDILLNDPTVGSQHCMIKYDPTTRVYLLKDLGEGSGTFLKIDREINLRSGFIVSFGDSHMAVTLNESPTTKSKMQGSKISLKFLDGPKTDEVYTFTKEDKVIKIGRMSDCDIRFEGSSLSRYQLTIEYNEEKGWVVADGYNGKNSTNGTWLYVEGFFEITDGTTAKIGQSLFTMDLVDEA